MNKIVFWFGLLGLFVANSWGNLPDTPIAYLKAMVAAHREQSYEQLYVLQKGEQYESWRYRHTLQNGQHYAQLLKLDDIREEIILQSQRVGYFGNFSPFSLNTDRIIDNLPSVIYADFDKLEAYSFIDLGRARMANRLARQIRILPNDNSRYQYLLWIDEETHLLLKSELLDRDKVQLEEFRVLQSTVDNELQAIAKPIGELFLPDSIPVAKQNEDFDWQAVWLPKGFTLKSANKQHFTALSGENEPIESRFYSDGLFSFTLYVMPNKGMTFDEQFWRDGKTSVYSQTIGNKDVIIVGEIPLLSARHILNEMVFGHNP